jgi:hypothetical protein
VWPSGAFKPSASAIALSKLYQHFRGRGSPCGLQDSLSTLRPSCSPGSRPRLRHGRKTRYGWVARPYPTGTCTLQEMPSLSWRDNAGRQARQTAGARYERTLFAIACSRLLDRARGWLHFLEPLCERLHHCHVPRRDEPFVTESGIKANPSTHHQHEGLYLARKYHVGGGGIGGRSYVGLVAFYHNIPLPVERSCEGKSIPNRGR